MLTDHGVNRCHRYLCIGPGRSMDAEAKMADVAATVTRDGAGNRQDVPTGPVTERRRRLAPAERMPQILDAALVEFAERGYGGARMAAVAERAGIAKGLIYHYVPSKQALFSATVRACTQLAFEAAERQVADRMHPARLYDDVLAEPAAEAGDADESHLLAQVVVARLAGRARAVDHERLDHHRVADGEALDTIADLLDDA